MLGLVIAASVAVTACEGCHGAAGNSVIAGTPSIAGQPETFLENQLVYFREGLRSSPVMQAVAKDLKDEEITELARHFGAQKASASTLQVDAAATQRGTQLAQAMHCGQCHLPNFEGRAQMPRLAGQREDYLVSAMAGYRDGTRTGADTTMSEVLYGMPDKDISALAKYLSALR